MSFFQNFDLKGRKIRGSEVVFFYVFGPDGEPDHYLRFDGIYSAAHVSEAGAVQTL